VTMSDNIEVLPPCVVRKDTVKGSMGPIESARPPPYSKRFAFDG